MDVAQFTTPVFIAKVVDFVVFVAALWWLWNRFGVATLTSFQEAQNKAMEDAAAFRESCARALEAASEALTRAKVDAARMVEIGQAQAQRVAALERAAAEEHAGRILAHAAGELDRERYRVRRELFEDTVERAHSEAQNLIERELTPQKQHSLIERLVVDLERTRA